MSSGTSTVRAVRDGAVTPVGWVAAANAGQNSQQLGGVVVVKACNESAAYLLDGNSPRLPQPMGSSGRQMYFNRATIVGGCRADKQSRLFEADGEAGHGALMDEHPLLQLPQPDTPPSRLVDVNKDVVPGQRYAGLLLQGRVQATSKHCMYLEERPPRSEGNTLLRPRRHVFHRRGHPLSLDPLFYAHACIVVPGPAVNTDRFEAL